MVSQQNLLDKAYFIAKMSGPTMSGRPVLTFGKRPQFQIKAVDTNWRFPLTSFS